MVCPEFGQTETTVAIANTPGQEVRPGSMGRPVPGDPIVLVDPAAGRRDGDGSGKIRGVALRDRERDLHADPSAAPPGEVSRSRADAAALEPVEKVGRQAP